MVKGTSAPVLDVSIWFETLGTTLSLAEEGKHTKYLPMVSTIMMLFPGLECMTERGFPVGARRKWHGPNWNILKRWTKPGSSSWLKYCVKGRCCLLLTYAKHIGASQGNVSGLVEEVPRARPDCS